MTLTDLDPTTLDALIDSRALYRLETYRETGILFVSNSTLGGAVKCRRAALLNALGFHARDGERLKMDAGTCAHLAIATYRKAVGMSTAERTALGLRTFADAYRPIVTAAFDRMDAVQLGYLQAYTLENLLHIMELAFTTFLPAYPFRVHPPLVEVPFAVPLCDDPPIVACGRMDALVETDDGLWLVDDVKTTGRIDGAFGRRFEMDSQFSHYTWAAAQHLGDRAIYGGCVTAIQFSAIPEVKTTKSGKAYKCRVHGVGVDECRDLHFKFEVIGPLIRDEGAHARWKATALYHALQLKTLYDRYLETGGIGFDAWAPVDGQFNGSCGYCEYREWGLAGYPQHQVGAMLTKDAAPDLSALRGTREDVA